MIGGHGRITRPQLTAEIDDFRNKKSARSRRRSQSDKIGAPYLGVCQSPQEYDLFLRLCVSFPREVYEGFVRFGVRLRVALATRSDPQP
jgi:ribosomal protein L32